MSAVNITGRLRGLCKKRPVRGAKGLVADMGPQCAYFREFRSNACERVGPGPYRRGDRGTRANVAARRGLLADVGEPDARQMDDVFGRALGDERAGTPAAAWSPATEITSSDDGWTLRVALPGIDPKDVHIELSGTSLTISGQPAQGCRRRRPRRRSSNRWGRPATIFAVRSSLDRACGGDRTPPGRCAASRAQANRVRAGPRSRHTRRRGGRRGRTRGRAGPRRGCLERGGSRGWSRPARGAHQAGASVARDRHSVGGGPGDGAHGDQTRSEDDTNTRAGLGLTNAQRGPRVGGDVRRRHARSACAPTETIDMRHAQKIFQRFFLTPCGWNRLQAEALGRAPRGERPYGITTRRRPVCR